MDSFFIVVWQGAITQFGVIKDLVDSYDDVHLANAEEVERYELLKKTEK